MRPGVLPQSASIVGLRYQIYLAGPVSFDADFSRMASTRNVIDPTQIATKRFLGTADAAVYGINVGVALGLTGRKSWHHIVPEVRAGAGVVTSDAKDDASGYTFGTPFAFTFGGGLKFVSLGRLQLRADVGERLYKQKYPDSFYADFQRQHVPAHDAGTVVLGESDAVDGGCIGALRSLSCPRRRPLARRYRWRATSRTSTTSSSWTIASCAA